MRTGDDVPVVDEKTTLREALIEIMDKSIGCTGVVNAAGNLTGIITDGDLKRILAARSDIFPPRPRRELYLKYDHLYASHLNPNVK